MKTVSALLTLLLVVALPAAMAAEPGMKVRGQAVFQHWCAPCHSPGGGMAGTAALQARYGGKLPAALEERQDLTPELVRLYVRRGETVMPPFRKTEITDSELDALATYLVRSQP